jgi:hypothetical protein
MRQFSGIRKGCVDVFKSQGRVASENLVSRGALCKVIENHGDRNSRTSRAKIDSTNAGVAAQVFCHTVMPGLYPRRAATRSFVSGKRIIRRSGRDRHFTLRIRIELSPSRTIRNQPIRRRGVQGKVAPVGAAAPVSPVA